MRGCAGANAVHFAVAVFEYFFLRASSENVGSRQEKVGGKDISFRMRVYFFSTNKMNKLQLTFYFLIDSFLFPLLLDCLGFRHQTFHPHSNLRIHHWNDALLSVGETCLNNCIGVMHCSFPTWCHRHRPPALLVPSVNRSWPHPIPSSLTCDRTTPSQMPRQPAS